MNERRSLWLLVFLLLAQLILLAGQASDPARGGSRLESGLLRVVGPFARLVDGSLAAVERVSYHLVLLSRLKQENTELRARVALLEREGLERRDLEGEVQALEQAVEYVRASEGPLVLAEILYIDHTSLLQTLIVDVGAEDVQVNQAVAAADGLVGRVVVRSGPYAKVQLVTDRATTAGAMIRRTRRQGLVRGLGAGRLVLDFVPLQEEVLPGDRVITAGIDGVYPRGIAIGTVAVVESGGELFHRIELAPAVDFGSLESVFILGRKPVPEEIREVSPDEGG